MINVGIDLHKTQFTTCVMRDDEIVDNGTKYEMSSEGYDSFASLMQSCYPEEEINLAIESTGNARFFRDTMHDYGFNVCVVNTLKFKVVNLSTNKTDKNDAKTLAEFLAKQLLPESHLCSAPTEGLRRVIKCRALMIQDQIALKNQAHAVLLAYGRSTPRSCFQSKKSRLKILATIVDEDLRKTLKSIFGTLDVVEDQEKVLESNLKDLTIHNHQVKNLMTVPGIGLVNACTIVAYTDDINRFENYKNYSAYCGLVPWVQTSNETSHYGRITKRGPQELRTALVQCTVAMIRMKEKTEDLSLMKNYQALKEDKNSGKAIIATARHLSRILYIMMKNDEPFNSAKLAKRD